MSKATPSKASETKSLVSAPAAHLHDTNIELAFPSITKRFGEGSIMRLGSNTKTKVETLSTGSLAIDIALSVGGLPLGRIIEVLSALGVHTSKAFRYDGEMLCHN